MSNSCLSCSFYSQSHTGVAVIKCATESFVGMFACFFNAIYAELQWTVKKRIMCSRTRDIVFFIQNIIPDQNRWQLFLDSVIKPVKFSLSHIIPAIFTYIPLTAVVSSTKYKKGDASFSKVFWTLKLKNLNFFFNLSGTDNRQQFEHMNV